MLVASSASTIHQPSDIMDAATRSAVIDILRQDAADGIQGGTAARDQEMALRFWQEEVNRYATTAEDYRMAMSIARAIHSDRNAMAAANQEEARAADDRRMAIQLAGGPRAARAQGYNRNKRQRVAPPAPRVNIRRVECVACTEQTPETDTIQTSCSHSYCRTCATKLFQDSLRDETLFPPRCCRNTIPLNLMQQFLDPAFNTRFEEKLVERRDTYRTYCAKSTCSRYLRPSNTGRNTLGPASRFCEGCNLWICEQCKKAHTPGSPCPEDEEVLRIGRQAGWKQCARCRNLVELTVGCNHMTCRCGYEFCYACSTPWKNCECVLWDEARLYGRADNGADQQRRDCRHGTPWRRIPGGRRCEECRNFMPRFTMQCAECDLRTCVRCRYNRM